MTQVVVARERNDRSHDDYRVGLPRTYGDCNDILPRYLLSQTEVNKPIQGCLDWI